MHLCINHSKKQTSGTRYWALGGGKPLLLFSQKPYINLQGIMQDTSAGNLPLVHSFDKDTLILTLSAGRWKNLYKLLRHHSKACCIYLTWAIICPMFCLL